MPAMPEPVDWLASYARVQRLADREVLATLRQAVQEINKDLAWLRTQTNFSSAVRMQQFQQTRRALLREMATVFRRTGDVIEARRLESAARAVKLGNAVDMALFSTAGQAGVAVATQLGEALLATQEHTLEVAMSRMGMSRVPLSQRVYNNSVALGGQLDRKINAALARGLSAREFADEVADFISPNTAGGIRYASMRLARTEINNAFHAMSAANMAEKPWVLGSKWNLSGSHPKADQCDRLAKDESDGMGAGVYKTAHIPSKPHPQCLCYITPEVEPDDVFLDHLVSGRYDEYLRSKTR